jgi:enoyl-CoA hydratase/carnithine racemase
MDDNILVRRDGAVLEIRMNRPAKKNALTKAMYAAMAEAMTAAEKDEAVRAVLIAAEGDIFSAGNDIADFAAFGNDASAGDAPHVNSFLDMLAEMEKPLIAAVTGNGVGVGSTMLLHCDIVIIAEHAQLTLPFTQLGLTPEAASSVLLPAQIGYKRAYMMLALGQPLNGHDAVALGIATEALPREEVGARARNMAQECCKRPPEAMRITKRLLRNKAQIKERMEVEIKYFQERLRSPEAKAAFEAFFNR